MKPSFAIATILSVVILMNCQPDNKKKDSATGEQPVVKTEEVRIFISRNNCTESDSACTYFKVHYMKVTGPTPKAAEAMNNQIQNTLLSLLKGFGSGTGLEKNLDQVGKEFVADYNAFIKEFPESAQVWMVEALMDKTFESGDITTFRIDVESYTGGAHGNYITKYLNFNSQSGESVGLTDVFTDTLQLKQALLDAMREQKGSDLEAAGFYLEDGEIPLNDNFGFTESGFLFHFDPYEIAPFSMGSIEIEIPRNAVKTKFSAPV